MNKIYKLIICIAIILSSCAETGEIFKGKPKTKAMPDWVISRPQESEYYIGIGSAIKNGINSTLYMSTAKKNALTDLASEISTKIESSSVLNTIQIDKQLSQQFVNQIKTENSLELEGYELMDSWENSESYWVYYRLSKKNYQIWKTQKKEDAIDNAKNKYLQAQNFIENQLYINAFQSYLEALSLIESYLYESTSCEINQQKTDLGNTIMNHILQFLIDSKIILPQNNIILKKGVTLSEPLCFSLKYQNKNNMENIPVKIEFTGKNIEKTSLKTDHNGLFCAEIEEIHSSKIQESLSLCIDMIAMSRLTSNHFIRQMIKNIAVPITTIPIQLENPSLQIISTERTFTKNTNLNILKNHAEDILKSNFDCSPDSLPDYLLKIETLPSYKEEFNNLTYILLECYIDLYNQKGNIVYQKKINEEFSGSNRQAALENGYNFILKMWNRSIKSDILHYTE